MASDKSLAAEIEAVLRDEIIPRWMGPNSFVEGYEEAAQKITARIAALQSRAFEDGARWMRDQAAEKAGTVQEWIPEECALEPIEAIWEEIRNLPLQPEQEKGDAQADGRTGAGASARGRGPQPHPGFEVRAGQSGDDR